MEHRHDSNALAVNQSGNTLQKEGLGCVQPKQEALIGGDIAS
jgi:hypothetical protein